ncbi:MAG: TonB-dependent receptor, partial [Burkholderiales bacterium]|nr:TonB-dependent receptor [Burkholderiales bacterium]
MSLRPTPRPAPHRLSALALAALGLFAQGAVRAQATPASPAASASERETADTQSVVVTGTRASLERAMAIKRDASVVQDSISATELGRFPDDNVADSLSHITGVSIS